MTGVDWRRRLESSAGAVAGKVANEVQPVWWLSAVQTGRVVFRQDHAGAVRIVIRDDGFSIDARGNGQTFRSRAR